MSTDLHNWDTIGKLAEREVGQIVTEDDYQRGGKKLIYLRSGGSAFFSDAFLMINHRTNRIAEESAKAFKRLVRDHVRPMV